MEKDLQEQARDLGRKGGLSTFKKYGADHYRKIQALGVATKKRNKKIRG